MSVEIRYAQTDDDVIHTHQFLCVVAGSTLPGPIDPKASATEVWRCATQDVVLMAVVGDRLVGTLGLVKPEFWWNPSLGFLANRFFFVLPGEKAARPLLKEARAIAVAMGVELHIYDENRGRLVIFNRHPNRRQPHPLLAPTAA